MCKKNISITLDESLIETINLSAKSRYIKNRKAIVEKYVKQIIMYVKQIIMYKDKIEIEYIISDTYSFKETISRQ